MVRNIVMDGRCVYCEKSTKTEAHAIFLCKRAKNIWVRILPDILRVVATNAPIRDILSVVANCLSVEEFLVFGISCWAIWNDRNALKRKEEICLIDTKVSGFSLMLPR